MFTLTWSDKNTHVEIDIDKIQHIPRDELLSLVTEVKNLIEHVDLITSHDPIPQ